MLAVVESDEPLLPSCGRIDVDVKDIKEAGSIGGQTAGRFHGGRNGP